MNDKLQQFLDQKHINIETYRKNGVGVKTPVWFVINEDDIIHLITRESTGKVKRLRNNQQVRIVPCSFKGEPCGEWISGKATMVQGSDAETVIKLRKKKYGFKALLSGFITKSKGDLVVYSISLD
jgi:hypothetical protein